MAQLVILVAAMKAAYDFLAHRIGVSDLRDGDHIYAFRSLMIYSHQGIYAGTRNGAHWVIHFLGGIKSDVGNLPCPLAEDCRTSPQYRHSGVTMTCLSCFLNGCALHGYKYGASREEYALKRGGTCTRALADDPQTVMTRALDMLVRNEFGAYDLVQRNCETFCLYCTTGNINSHSNQVLKRDNFEPVRPAPQI